MVLHVLQCKRPLCHCLRVPYLHRPGSFLLCECNELSPVAVAARMGASDEELDDLMAEVAFTTKGKPSAVCPF